MAKRKSNWCSLCPVGTMLLLFSLNGYLITVEGDTDSIKGLKCEDKTTDIPTTSTKVIESFHIKSDIRFRFATTQIVSVVRNLANVSQEIFFDIALPKEAFIVSFSMAIDGKVYEGEVKEKAQAKKDYQTAIDKGESAGIVENAPRHSNTFDVSVNVAGGSVVSFTLNYQELLQRKLGVYEYTAHVKPGQAVEDFLVEVNIQENKKIISVKTPALRTDSLLTNEITEENPLTIIETTSPQSARVLFKPTKSQQCPGGVSARFVVQYDVEHPPKGEILVVDGYFIHFFAPDLPPIPKDIVFVLDVSGSMHGTRLAQLKSAMKVILKDLKPRDKFNIITFSSDVRKWQKVPVQATADQITAADKFVQEMKAEGMTNIHKALMTALGELKSHSNKERASKVFFLTDGDPTEGELDYRKIASDVGEANEMKSAIFSLAFGDDAKYESLQTIAAQNSGFARKIYEASDAALQVANLYKEISSIVMKDISVSFLPSSVDQFTVTESKFTNIFNGSEVVICGLMRANTREFQVSINGIQQSGEVNLVLETNDISNFILSPDDPLFSGPRDFAGIVEKMWAYLTVKQLLREKDKNLFDEDKTKELNKKIIDMSLKYKFVTPLTAMVVTKPDQKQPSESILKEDGRKADVTAQANMMAFSGGRRYMRPVAAKSAFGPRGYGGSMFAPDPMEPTTSIHNVLAATQFPRSRTTKNVIQGYTTRPPTGDWFKDFPLAALVIQIGKKNVCIVPKKINNGAYRLVMADDGYFINLEVGCSKLPCPTKKAMKILVSYRNSSAVVDLVNIAKDSWSYTASSNFVIDQVANNLTVTGENSKLSFSWHKSGNKGYYNVIIELDHGKKYTGLTADIMRKAGKQQKKKVEPACRSLQTQASIKFNNKLASKYRLNNRS